MKWLNTYEEALKKAKDYRLLWLVVFVTGFLMGLANAFLGVVVMMMGIILWIDYRYYCLVARALKRKR